MSFLRGAKKTREKKKREYWEKKKKTKKKEERKSRVLYVCVCGRRFGAGRPDRTML